jgi:hypothetical protein
VNDGCTYVAEDRTTIWAVGEVGDSLRCRVIHRLSRRQRETKMATEGHRGGQGEDHQQKNKAEIDKELREIREKMENIALKMQQEAKVHWKYEWPLKKKEKFHVEKLLTEKQQHVLKRWLRHAENLSDTEEMVHICETETGKTLSDDEEKRSVKDLIN